MHVVTDIYTCYLDTHISKSTEKQKQKTTTYMIVLSRASRELPDVFSLLRDSHCSMDLTQEMENRNLQTLCPLGHMGLSLKRLRVFRVQDVGGLQPWDGLDAFRAWVQRYARKQETCFFNIQTFFLSFSTKSMMSHFQLKHNAQDEGQRTNGGVDAPCSFPRHPHHVVHTALEVGPPLL